MSNSFLAFKKLGNIISGIIDDIRHTDSRVRALENLVQVGTDPSIEAAGFSNILNPHCILPVKVISHFTTPGYQNIRNSFYKGRVQKPSSGTWEDAFEDDVLIQGTDDMDIGAGTVSPVDAITGVVFAGNRSAWFYGFNMGTDWYEGAYAPLWTTNLSVSCPSEPENAISGVCAAYFEHPMTISEVSGPPEKSVKVSYNQVADTVITVVTNVNKGDLSVDVTAEIVDLTFTCGLLTGVGTPDAVYLECCIFIPSNCE